MERLKRCFVPPCAASAQGVFHGRGSGPAHEEWTESEVQYMSNNLEIKKQIVSEIKGKLEHTLIATAEEDETQIKF